MVHRCLIGPQIPNYHSVSGLFVGYSGHHSVIGPQIPNYHSVTGLFVGYLGHHSVDIKLGDTYSAF